DLDRDLSTIPPTSQEDAPHAAAADLAEELVARDGGRAHAWSLLGSRPRRAVGRQRDAEAGEVVRRRLAEPHGAPVERLEVRGQVDEAPAPREEGLALAHVAGIADAVRDLAVDPLSLAVEHPLGGVAGHVEAAHGRGALRTRGDGLEVHARDGEAVPHVE